MTGRTGKQRIAAKIVLFLLLGAIVNIAVAWVVIAATHRTKSFVIQRSESAIPWPRRVPAHWPDRTTFRRFTKFGSHRDEYSHTRMEGRPGEPGKTELFRITVDSVGWPGRSLQWERWSDFLWRADEIPGEYHADGRPKMRMGWGAQFIGQPKMTWWRAGITLTTEKFGFGRQSGKRLPIRPIWPGFAINTLFYAALLWLTFCGPFALRRHLRRKRGRCLKCGYDLRGTRHVGCPEMGMKARCSSLV